MPISGGGGGPPGGGGGGGPGYVESLGRISGPLLAANLRRNEDLAFRDTALDDPVLYLKVTGTAELPVDIEVGPSPTGVSLTSNSVTLPKSFYSQSLVNSLVGQTAVIDRYPNPPLVYTVVSIVTEPLSPTEWRMTVDTTFNPAGQVKPISFYPNAGVIQLVTNDIWDTTGNSIGEKWVAWYKTNLPGTFTTLVQPGWIINVAGTIYVVDYIIEDPVNTNMWRIYVTTSLVGGVGIPIFSTPTYTGTPRFIGVNTDAPNNPLTVLGKTLTTNLVVDTHAETPNFYISTNRIQNLVSAIYLQPNQTTDPQIHAPKIGVLNLRISDLLIENITNNNDINLEANTGRVVFNTSKVYVDGALHATGDITFDGDVTFGTDNTDNVTFSADVASSIVPDDNITWDLGSTLKRWATAYITDLYVDNITISGLNAATLEANGTTQVAGNAFLGSDSSDVITLTSKIDNNLIPTAETYTLGNNTTPKIWKTLFLTGLDVDGRIDVRSNTITTLATDEALELIASGTGRVYIQYTDVNITQDLNVDGNSTLGNVSITGLLDLPGAYTWTQTGNSVRNGVTLVAGIDVITGFYGQSGVILTGPNSKTITVNVSVIGVITIVSVDSGALSGTYVSTGGTRWLYSQTGNTDITGSLTVNGANTVQFSDIQFVGNVVRTTLGTDLELSANGTGIVKTMLSDVEITNNLDVLGTGYLNEVVVITSVSPSDLNLDFVVGNISISGNTVTTTTGNLILSANNTGKIHVTTTDVVITNDLEVNQLTTLANVGITGALDLAADWNQTGNADRTGNTDITGTLTLKSPNITQFQDISVTNNIITTTVTDNDLRLVPDGTGQVHVVTTNVQITNDLDVGQYGYFGSLTVGTGITVPEFTVGDIHISNNDITTISTNRDLVLQANGAGIVHLMDSDVAIPNNLTSGSLNVNGATSLKNTFIGTTGAVGSAQFSGSNYLSVAGGVGTAMGTGDFTWECWVYPTASSSYQAFIDTRTNPLGGGDTTGFYFGTNFNTITPMYYTNGLQLASSIDLTLNSWNHVALTRASGNVTIWVNGASGGTRTGDTTDLSQQRVFIGSSGLDLYLTGRITNLRIVKGTAVYTIPFATPNTVLTAIAGTQLLLLEDTSGNLLKDSSANNFTVTNNSSVTWSALSPVISALSPNDLTQTGNINQTGSTYIEGTFANNNVTVLNPSYLTVPNFKFENNVIQVTAPATDLVINSLGGGVVFNRILKIADNIIGNIFDVNDIELAFNNLYLTEDNQLLLTEDGDNYLLDTNSAGDLSVRFRPSGTGKMRINSTKALAVAYGNNTNRVLGDVGEIRQNSTTGLYEGYSPTGLVSFNNIYDNDRNTYITPELTPGANDNILRFGINGSVRATISSTILFSSNLNVDNVSITGTTISNLISANDLELSPVGTGYVSINDILFTNNTVAPVSDDPLILESTGTGYFKFTGSGGLVIPVGNSSTERPLVPELGEVRYNSTGNYTEVFNGSAWVSASGASSAATEEDIAAETNLWAFVLG